MSIFKTAIRVGLFLFYLLFLFLCFLSIKEWYISGATIFPDLILIILGLLFVFYVLPPTAAVLFDVFEAFFLDLGEGTFWRAPVLSIIKLILFVILFYPLSLVLDFLLPESYTLTNASILCFAMIVFCLPTMVEDSIQRRMRMRWMNRLPS